MIYRRWRPRCSYVLAKSCGSQYECCQGNPASLHFGGLRVYTAADLTPDERDRLVCGLAVRAAPLNVVEWRPRTATSQSPVANPGASTQSVSQAFRRHQSVSIS